MRILNKLSRGFIPFNKNKLILGIGTTLLGSAICYNTLKHKTGLFDSLILAGENEVNKIFGWGSGLQGQLGLGNEIMAVSTPTELPELEDIKVKEMRAGSDISAMITDEGQIFTWGRTRGATMGKGERGLTSNILLPTHIADLEKHNFTHIACGRSHLAAVSAEGDVWMWGTNDYGKLGLKPPPPPAQKPQIDIRAYHPTNYADKGEMGQVWGLPPALQVECGFHHSVAVDKEGDVYTWGRGKEGALGQGGESWADSGVPLKVEGVKERVSMVQAGGEYTLVLTKEGNIFAWGRNNYGQLGVAGKTLNKFNVPTKIMLPKDIKVKSISAGEEHAAFLTAEGNVYTWGYGNDGQLGHMKKDHLMAPQKITTVTGVKKVVCGGGHTALLTNTGKLYLFGRGRDGQLGRGDHVESISVSRSNPLEVDYFSGKGLNIEDVALGTNHTLALVK